MNDHSNLIQGLQGLKRNLPDLRLGERFGARNLAAILSEGEQRALSIACFFAESHVAGRKSAIIFDDPVTSLDHKRLTYRYEGRDFRLTDVAGRVVEKLVS